jgi:hypothetical protein
MFMQMHNTRLLFKQQVLSIENGFNPTQLEQKVEFYIKFWWKFWWKFGRSLVEVWLKFRKKRLK